MEPAEAQVLAALQERDDLAVEVERLRSYERTHIENLDLLREEVERLRAALKRIATSKLSDWNTPHPELCADIARAALTKDTTEAAS